MHFPSQQERENDVVMLRLQKLLGKPLLNNKSMINDGEHCKRVNGYHYQSRNRANQSCTK